MHKTEFKEKLIHFSNLIRTINNLIEVYFYYRTSDKLKTIVLAKMVTDLLILEEADFFHFSDLVQQSGQEHAGDNEMNELLTIYGDLRAKEIEMLKDFKVDVEQTVEYLSKNPDTEESVKDKMPAHEEFFQIHIFDDKSVWQRIFLNKLRRRMKMEEFNDFTSEFNQLNLQLPVFQRINDETKELAIATYSEYGLDWFSSTLNGAVDDQLTLPVEKAKKLTYFDEINARLSSEVITTLAISDDHLTIKDWTFTAMIAHWRIYKRLISGKICNEFAKDELALKDLYTKCLRNDAEEIKNISFKSRKEKKLLEVFSMILLSEIIQTVHELKGDPNDFGIGSDDDIYPEIFDDKNEELI